MTVQSQHGGNVRYRQLARKALIRQCGGRPTPTEWRLIDRCAAISARLHVLDCDPPEEPAREYIELTIALGQLLVQLGVEPAVQASAIVPVPQTCEVAA